MKKQILKTVFLILTFVFVFSLTCCTSEGKKFPFNIFEKEDIDGENSDSEKLILIEDNVARFRFVYTQEAGSGNVRLARELTSKLRALGVEIADPVSETMTDKITDCEIIIGTGAKYRGDELGVSAIELGKDGKLIKIVGEKILIAGGTQALTYSLFESFVTLELKITNDIKSLDFLSIDSSYSLKKLTEYIIESIKIGGVDLNKFTIVYDIDKMGDYNTGVMKREFKNKLYDISGCWLEEGEICDPSLYEHAFVIRYTEDAGDCGFRIYYNGKDLIAECSYANAFEGAFEEFIQEKIYNTGSKAVELPADLKYEKDVTIVTYRQFGAKGDGISDDYPAILAAHEYANAGGQKVLGTENAVYYISSMTFTDSIIVKTDVDFMGAKFIVDDRGEAAYANRNKALFMLSADETPLKFSVGTKSDDIANKALEFDGIKVSIPSGTKKLDWIKPYINVTSMVRIRNMAHRDYIRHGSNQNNGQYRHEMIIVDPEGNVSDETNIFFDYEKLTDVYIWRCDDKPIVIENGTFYNLCCRAVASTEYATKYHAYTRGFRISRANVTIKNLNHGMVDQPETISSKSDEQGSYPYGGFLKISETYNLKVEKCELAGHVTYFEKKVATDSANLNGNYNYVPAGSYDLSLGDSTHITFEEVTQKNTSYTMDEKTHEVFETNGTDELTGENYFGIGDNKYWGIMGSGNSRNLKFNKCIISRIDAHEGFFNVEVIDTVIGHTFHAVGGGYLKLHNMTRLAGNSYIVTRGDYGGTFNGEMTIENGTLLGYQSYNSSPWYNGDRKLNTDAVKYKEGYVLNTGYPNENDRTGTYWTWDFGYDCYMPETIRFIGAFNSKIPKIYISKKDYDYYYEKFVPTQQDIDPDYRGYELIKQIIYQDFEGNKMPINKNAEIYGVYSDYPALQMEKGDYMASHCDIIELKTKD